MQNSTQLQTIKNVVKMAQNKFVGLTFVKKDGTTRRLNGRFNVHSKTGAKASTAHMAQYVTIYDVKIGGFRNVNLDSLQSIRTGGIEININ